MRSRYSSTKSTGPKTRQYNSERPYNEDYGERANGNIKAFVFDLDGTLIDSKLDLVNSVNAMLRETGRPEQPRELVASYVGHGAPQLIASVFGRDLQRKMGVNEGSGDVFLKHYEIAEIASHAAISRSSGRIADASGNPDGGVDE